MELSDYLKTLIRHWLVIVILVVLGAAAGYGMAKITPPSYRAQASVLVYSQKGDNTSELVQGSTFAQNMVTSYAALATTPAVLAPAIASLGLNTTAQDLARSVTADVPLNTVIIQIGVTGSSATEVARTADAIAISLGDAVHTLSPKGLKGASTVTAEPVAQAAVPTHPYAPNANLMIGTGLAVGLALGIIFALIRGTRSQQLRPTRSAAHPQPAHEDASPKRSHGTVGSATLTEPARIDEEAPPTPVGTFEELPSASELAESEKTTGEGSGEKASEEDEPKQKTRTKPGRTLHVVEADGEEREESDADNLRPTTAQ